MATDSVLSSPGNTSLRINGTFLDEISHDIPHQNWGAEEWDADFRAMKAMGIDTVVVIRCGYRHWMTYPSRVLAAEGCFPPAMDLIALFLELAEKYDMRFFLGTYDSGRYWQQDKPEREIDISMRVVDEIWDRYGSSPAFQGWYLSLEVSRRIGGIIDIYSKLGKHCKDVSGNLPVLISPWIEGVKAVYAFSSTLEKGADETLGLAQHEEEWNDIMGGIAGAVDIVAFQDGHVGFDELEDYLHINKNLAEKHGLQCWTNCESFDRDMPIKFLPIKWDKLLLKLQIAEAVGIDDAITFEFSHFMSPNSCYPQAHGLYRRYCEHFNINPNPQW